MSLSRFFFAFLLLVESRRIISSCHLNATILGLDAVLLKRTVVSTFLLACFIEKTHHPLLVYLFLALHHHHHLHGFLLSFPTICSSSSIATTPRGPTSRDFPCHIKLVIPHAALAQLLSNKGQRMKEIESQHGVVIQTSRYGKASLNPRERLVTIASKDYASCKAALQSILEVIYSNDSEGAEEQLTNTIVVRLVIPSSCAGIILGPGGDQIARINDAVGASVIIESKMPNAAFIPYRIVNVSGTEIGPCMDAITYVLDLLEKDMKYAEIIKEINSVAFQIVPFPASRAGAVLGPGGAHIKSLQDILKVKIGITSNASNDVGRNSIKHAAVWGMADNVRVACDVLTVATGGTLADSVSRSSLYPMRRIENSSPENIENSSV